jgi:hypothetical protein
VLAAHSDELLSRVQTWLSYSYAKRHTVENKAELHQLYALISGGSATGCTNCNFAGYVGYLEAYEQQSLRFLHPELVKDSAYTFAPGYENETFVHENYSEVVSAKNLTDKGAEFFIKQGFGHAFLKNGKPVATESAEAAPKPKTKAEWAARYAEILGTEPEATLTIAQLAEAIEAKEQEKADEPE